MKKKIIILTSSILVILSIIICGIIIHNNRIPYTEEPSNHIIYESSEQYYLAFNYKGFI